MPGSVEHRVREGERFHTLTLPSSTNNASSAVNTLEKLETKSSSQPGRCRLPANLLGYLPFPRPLHTDNATYSPHFTLIGSEDLDVRSRSYLSSQYRHRILKNEETARLPPKRSGFNPRPGHSGFSHVGVVPDDALVGGFSRGSPRSNACEEETGDPWENLATSGSVRHDSHLRKSEVNRPSYDRKHCTLLARRSDEVLGVHVNVARIAPSLLDFGHGVPTGNGEYELSRVVSTRRRSRRGCAMLSRVVLGRARPLSCLVSSGFVDVPRVPQTCMIPRSHTGRDPDENNRCWIGSGYKATLLPAICRLSSPACYSSVEAPNTSLAAGSCHTVIPAKDSPCTTTCKEMITCRRTCNIHLKMPLFSLQVSIIYSRGITTLKTQKGNLEFAAHKIVSGSILRPEPNISLPLIISNTRLKLLRLVLCCRGVTGRSGHVSPRRQYLGSLCGVALKLLAPTSGADVPSSNGTSSVCQRVGRRRRFIITEARPLNAGKYRPRPLSSQAVVI
ncbi:hypothetical protein PR048_027449 [Dryococelus australis]|uniref:Uncharacterized protein n=1 Tax=Dryococelus australis TaxID=614101 RepID=A0ABQ9GFH8_9NEOP|nr:hypothetical protein PR048_027449 [Dryococelus australis]